MHVAHTPFCVWMPCCTHSFQCVDAVLHTPLFVCGFRVAQSFSVCAFLVAHMPFCVCIPCYTHLFLCVHSVLHPFLCVHSVLHTSLSMCAFRVTSLSMCAFRVTSLSMCAFRVTSLSMCAFLAVRSGLSAAGLGLELPNLLQEGGLREEGLR